MLTTFVGQFRQDWQICVRRRFRTTPRMGGEIARRWLTLGEQIARREYMGA